MQGVEDLHLVRDQIDVDDFRHLGMKALERAPGHLGIERTHPNLICGKVVEQSASDRRLPDSSLVGTDKYPLLASP